jgi:superkiller protein 8
LKIYSTTTDDYPLHQTLDNVHRLGCHHIIVDGSGTRAVSIGFGGEAKIWSCTEGQWKLHREIEGVGKKAGELWAVCLSLDGRYLAGTSAEGKIHVWDLGSEKGPEKMRTYETKGSFGLAVDLVRI